MSRKAEGGDEFLRVAMQNFLQGMGAMARFRREVCAVARRALERSLPSLEAALHLELKPDNIKLYQRPNGVDAETDWSGEDAVLGVSLVVPETVTIDAMVWWKCAPSESAPTPVAYVLFTPYRAPARDKLFPMLRRKEPALVVEGWEIWLETPLTEQDAPKLEEKLDELFARWV